MSVVNDGGFVSSCKRELYEGVHSGFMGGFFEMITGVPEDGRPYVDNPNTFGKRFRSSLFRGFMVQHAMKKGYDPVKMLTNAQMFQMVNAVNGPNCGCDTPEIGG